MEYGVFKKIIDEIKWNQRRLFLHLGGETLLHPEFSIFAGYASAAGLQTCVSTNGTIMTEALAEGIIGSGLSELIFAVDSLDPVTYGTIRKGASLDRVLENIDLFCNTKRRLNALLPKVTIQKIADLDERDRDSEFTRYWKDKVDRVFIKKLFGWEGTLDLKKRGEVVRTLPCFMPWTNCVVLSDGTVCPCCIDYNGTLALGNVGKTSLKEIWNGKEAENLRRAHSVNDYPEKICRRCLEFQTAQTPLFLFKKETVRKVAGFLRQKYE
jgi:radical SAM protein with 4Fe4S-binding SPASM domain